MPCMQVGNDPVVRWSDMLQPELPVLHFLWLRITGFVSRLVGLVLFYLFLILFYLFLSLCLSLALFLGLDRDS